MRHRVLLGDRSAHRHARQVEAGQPEPGHERLEVGGHLAAGVRPRRRAGPADPAVVVTDHAQARGHEVVHLIRPNEREAHRLLAPAEVFEGKLYLGGELVA